MCTVTFLPTPAGIHLTSNRDERIDRPVALQPERYRGDGYELLYPKDAEAGGSWIALKDNGDAAVLLNGAFVKHQRRPSYRRSRGLVFLEVIEAPRPEEQFNSMDLGGIAPFTLILFVNGELGECRWDGYRKHNLALNARQPYIWSSATLYDDRAIAERKRWFRQWLQQQQGQIRRDDILHFHQHSGNGDTENSLVMNRNDQTLTVSITSMFIAKDELRISYKDLRSGGHTEKAFGRRQERGTPEKYPLTKRWRLSWRKLMIRARHWEYWPSRLIYGPLYLYWLWLSIKARSLFFFSAANPGIDYAGFAQERKSDIYKLIPERYYPRTRFCASGTQPELLLHQLEKDRMAFPLIAKPDMGERGVQVKLLQTRDDLWQYCAVSKVDFIVQEYIDHALEAGIFYYRIPGEESGHISGIVGKTFLAVTGDGRSSIAALLEKEDRSLLQLSALCATHGAALGTVMPRGERRVIMPYGNHSRGALFADLSHHATAELTAVVDAVCKQIPGFYYGRLDIRFKSWEELAQGKSFSIIELNGAGSEPTHIYDPGHSLFFAWKEIARHWKLLYEISRLNARRQGLTLMSTLDGIRMLQDHARYLKQVEQI